ncbi:hypothetical protein BJ508DRAFT_349940 [Ascobolus immersus RN42]|uniref:Uncharacterized protein n=1 Tax=Ascobolus immersus RN42 TaxID=1160509 RepID=A0A3N4HXV2_ASCIM|nr:hypothetical protein BJ508DRAFT_349940 [Ascobolus immersus RN42]
MSMESHHSPNHQIPLEATTQRPWPECDPTIPTTWSPRTQTLQAIASLWTESGVLYFRSPSSSGKSTLAHLLASYLRHTHPTATVVLITGAALHEIHQNEGVNIEKLLSEHGWRWTGYIESQDNTYIIIDGAEPLYTDYSFWNDIRRRSTAYHGPHIAMFATQGLPRACPTMKFPGIEKPVYINARLGRAMVVLSQPTEEVNVGVCLKREEVREMMVRLGVSRYLEAEEIVWELTAGHAGAVGVLCHFLRAGEDGDIPELLTNVVVTRKRCGLRLKYEFIERIEQMVNEQRLHGFPLSEERAEVVGRLRDCWGRGGFVVPKARFGELGKEDPWLDECIAKRYLHVEGELDAAGSIVVGFPSRLHGFYAECYRACCPLWIGWVVSKHTARKSGFGHYLGVRGWCPNPDFR